MLLIVCDLINNGRGFGSVELCEFKSNYEETVIIINALYNRKPNMLFGRLFG